MKFTRSDLDAEGLETENFVKLKSKKQKLTGKQSVRQLRVDDPFDPKAKFAHPDLNQFSKMDLLDELISGIKTGKEASVYLGRNAEGFVAVKVYTDLRVRSFRHDESYREGRFIGDSRLERAIEQGSGKGLDARQILWVQEEFRQMNQLYEHGVRVPKAIAVNGISILMEFIGDEDGSAAPRISDLKMDTRTAEAAFQQSVENLKLIVSLGRVHGDYSTFNILWHKETAVVIDFPQVMEFRHNRNAHAFLERDVVSLCKSFRKQGIRVNEEKIFREIQAAYRSAHG